MDKKFLIGWVMLFVAWMVGSFVAHWIVAKQMLFDGVLMLVLGAIVAWWYRGDAAAA